MAMANEEIRKKILQELYSIYFDSPFEQMRRAELLQKLKITKNELDANMLYLEEKGFVVLFKTLGDFFLSARITALGVDYVEQNKLV